MGLQGIVSAAGAGALLGMTSFRIGHDDSFLKACIAGKAGFLLRLAVQLVAKIFERFPTRVLNGYGARALFCVQVRAALRAQAAAILAAQGSERKR
jgi:hypothetical protein